MSDNLILYCFNDFNFSCNERGWKRSPCLKLLSFICERFSKIAAVSDPATTHYWNNYDTFKQHLWKDLEKTHAGNGQPVVYLCNKHRMLQGLFYAARVKVVVHQIPAVPITPASTDANVLRNARYADNFWKIFTKIGTANFRNSVHGRVLIYGLIQAKKNDFETKTTFCNEKFNYINTLKILDNVDVSFFYDTEEQALQGYRNTVKDLKMRVVFKQSKTVQFNQLAAFVSQEIYFDVWKIMLKQIPDWRLFMHFANKIECKLPLTDDQQLYNFDLWDDDDDEIDTILETEEIGYLNKASEVCFLYKICTKNYIKQLVSARTRWNSLRVRLYDPSISMHVRMATFAAMQTLVHKLAGDSHNHLMGEFRKVAETNNNAGNINL